MRKPPFDDIRIRKAFNHLFNREGMIKEMFFDQYIPMDSYFAGQIYENPDNPKYRYDPEKAIKLLAQAGWTEKNEEGILMKDGRPFALEMSIVQALDRIITPFQQELRKVGIDLQLKFADGNTLFKNVMERNFTIHWQPWSGLVFPNPETSWHSKLADQKYNNNLSGVKNERIDEICDLYDVEFDQAERVKLIREADKIAMDMAASALSWYAPFHRILYWNKFGMPEHYFSLYVDYHSIYSLWWYDEEKARKLKEAMKKDKPLPIGETEVKFWPEYKKAHGM